jgi:hypothetical protein
MSMVTIESPPLAGIMFFIVFGLSIFSLVGLGYLSKFSFKSKRFGSKECVDMNDREKNVCQATVVILWVIVGLSVLGGLYKLFSGGLSKRTNFMMPLS